MKLLKEAKIGEADKTGKTHWKTVGKLYEKDNGQQSFMVDLGVNGKVWMQLFDPRPEEGQQTKKKSFNSFDDDDIPFGR